MDYFNLPRAGQSSASTSSSTDHHLRDHHRHQQAQHAVIVLEGMQEDVPTPRSHSPLIAALQVGTPSDHPGVISISTAFHPSLLIDGALPDIILVSVDGVHFHAHRSRILAISTNRLGNLIQPDAAPSTTLVTPPSSSSSPPASIKTVHMPQTGDVLNVILHTIYGLSCLPFLPTLEVVDAALDALVLLYGVHIQAHAAPHMPLHQLILSFAPFRPLDAYALAAHHALEPLAVAISSHLLAYNLARLPDSAAQKMGPLYLKRLFLLHQSRLNALRTILFKAPAAHALAPGLALECNEHMQQQLTRAWAHAVAQLVWDVLPSISISALQSLLEPIGVTITCPLCLVALQRRVQEVMYEWSMVKRTI